MADLLHSKLLDSPSFNLPLKFSSRPNFSIIRFTPFRRTRSSRFSPSSTLLAKLSSDSTRFDIISTCELSDGSVVFKFGDASETVQSVENVISDTKSELRGTLDGEHDVSDTESKVLRTSDGEHDSRGTESTVLDTLDGDNDVTDVTSELPGTSDGDNDISDPKSDSIGTSDSEHDKSVTKVLSIVVNEQNANDTKSEVPSTLYGAVDVSDTELELPSALDGERDVSVTKLEVPSISDGEPDVSDANLELTSISDGEHDVSDTESGVLNILDGERDVSDEKVEVPSTVDGEHDVCDTKSGVSSVLDGGHDVSDEKVEVPSTLDGEHDVSDTKSSVSSVLDGEHDASDEKVEVPSTVDGEHDVSGEKMEVSNTVDGEHDVSDTKSGVSSVLDGGHDVSDKKLEVPSTVDGENVMSGEEVKVPSTTYGEHDVSDTKSGVSSVSVGARDVSDAKMEVPSSADCECDVSDVKLELASTSRGEKSVSKTKLEVPSALDGEHAANETKLEVPSALHGECVVMNKKSEDVSGISDDDHDANSMKLEGLGTLDGECDDGETKSDMLETFDAEHDVRATKSEQPGSLDDEDEVKLGNESDSSSANQPNEVPESELPKVDESDGTKLENTVETEPQSKESLKESNVQMGELVGLRCETETSADSRTDSLASSHYNEDSVEKEENHNLILTSEMEKPIDSEIVKHDVELYSLTRTVDSSMDLIMENSQEIGDGKPVAALSTSQLKFDSNQSVEIAALNSPVEASVMVESAEEIEVDSDVKHVVNDDNDLVRQAPRLFEAEPLLEEEASSDSVDDLATLDSALGSDTGVVEAASPEAPMTNIADTNLDSMGISTPELSLSSAAASLLHSSEALTGGEDAHFICQNWFGVADGVGQWSFGGINGGLYARELMKNCEKLALNSQNAGMISLKEVLQQSAAITQSTGSTRVLIAHCSNQVLHVANIGDTGFVIIRNGAIFKKSSPMFHEFHFPCAIGSGDDPLEAVEEYDAELEDGDVIVAATDGLFDNLYEQEIASVVSKSVEAGMEIKDIAQLLAAKAQEVGTSASARTPFADAAQAAGHTGYNGGKLDHVTVIVSLVQQG